MFAMALHHSLRELIVARGTGVTEDPTEFRGALDDFLAEDEASLGEVNLLVDAVRLGALARLTTLLDRDADPGAALDETAAGLARDRGTDDVRRSRWALAALGYALGRLDAAFTGLLDTEASAAAPEPSAPPSAQAAPVVAPTRMLTDHAVTSAPAQPPTPVPVPASHPAPPPTAYVAPQPAPYAASGAPAGPWGPPPRRRTGLVLGIVAVVVLVLGVAAVVAWTLRDDDGSDDGTDDSAETDPTGQTDPTDPTDSRTDGGAALGLEEIVVPLEVEGATSIFAVDADSGATRQLTTGVADLLPSVSPDRSDITYLRGPRPFTIWSQEVAAGDPTQVFADNADCAHASRPAWSPDGTRIAIVCSGDDDVPDGIYVADGGFGGTPELVVEGDGFAGSPTWIDEERFIYTVRTEVSPGQLWLYDTSTTSDTPLDVGTAATDRLSHPDWSDDQQQLLFVVHEDPEDEYGNLWTVGGDFTGAAAVGGPVAHPAWAPEGDRIVVTVHDPVDPEIEHLAVVTATNASDPTVVDLQDVPENAVVGVPAWGVR
jgi:hypothetical protein